MDSPRATGEALQMEESPSLDERNEAEHAVHGETASQNEGDASQNLEQRLSQIGDQTEENKTEDHSTHDAQLNTQTQANVEPDKSTSLYHAQSDTSKSPEEKLAHDSSSNSSRNLLPRGLRASSRVQAPVKMDNMSTHIHHSSSADHSQRPHSSTDPGKLPSPFSPEKNLDVDLNLEDYVVVSPYNNRDSSMNMDLKKTLGFTNKNPNWEQHFDYAYNSYDSRVHQTYMKHKSERDLKKDHCMRWMLTFVVAILTAITAIIVWYASDKLREYKYEKIQELVSEGKSMMVFPALVIWSMVLVGLAASAVTYIEPRAGGSGIPEIKCHLNGLKIAKVVRVKTLIVKVFGVICAVAAGLYVGKEGPMVHSGAICGAGVNRGTFKKCGLKVTLWNMFSNDRDKRDLVSCGTAAGVATAFGAPIGGVLFALEEGCSFWNQSLTWRTLFCSMTATSMFSIFVSISTKNKLELSTAGLLQFGDFAHDSNTNNFSAYEIPWYCIVGIIGGVLGAFFNALSKRLFFWRKKHIAQYKWRKILEALLVAAVTSLVSFGIPYFATKSCRPLPQDGYLYIDGLVQFNCADTEFHELATLFLSPSDNVIQQLFHTKSGSFSYGGLIVVGVVIYFLSCWTYGTSIPSGLFIPQLMVGSCFGRLFGELIKQMGLYSEINPGMFSLLGAAAMLGGFARMTISLTVILIETSGEVTYGLPILIVLHIAKWTGDLFNHGLYDNVIFLNHYPFLEWDPSHSTEILVSKDIMETNFECLPQVLRVKDLHQVLMNSSWNGFPVVQVEPKKLMYDADLGRRLRFRGEITRNFLVVILMHPEAFFEEKPNPFQEPPGLRWKDFEAPYPHYPRAQTLEFTLPEWEQWIDLTPYMNLGAFTVEQDSPVSHAFRIFRSMGLRHLYVLDEYHECVGIITRMCLSHEAEVERRMLLSAKHYPDHLPRSRSRFGLGSRMPRYSDLDEEDIPYMKLDDFEEEGDEKSLRQRNVVHANGKIN